MTHPKADLNFSPAPVEVRASSATPEAVAAGITANQQQMQKVNDLSRGGSARSRSRSSKKVKPHSRRRRHIRTYRHRGRQQQQQQQNGGAAAAGAAIIIPQAPGQATCTEGAQCAGAQNANLTSVLNQAKSSGANDAYAGGGKKRMRKTRNSQKRRKSHHRQ
jgi:hypothetical protein